MGPDDQQAERRVLLRYAVAVAVVLLAAGVRLALQPLMGVAPPYITFYLAIAAASAFGGFGPGFFATLLGGLLGVGLAMGNGQGLQLQSPAELIRLLVYVLSGLAISSIAGRMHRARHQAAAELQELRELSDQLRVANRRLVESDRSKDRFVALVAHELRNPLTPLKGGLRLLRARADDPQAVQKTVGMMARQVDQMARIVNDLLDATRIRQNKLDLHRTRVDLGGVVAAVVDDYRQQYLSRSVGLHLHKPSSPVCVHGDAGRLSQAFGNLLHNALKFTPDGGEVVVDLESRDETAVLRVRDNGVGLAPELLTRIFEPFEQGDTAARHAAGGLGLGLALVKTIVELHGGGVQAHSAGRDAGAEFVVTLPLDLTPEIEEPVSILTPLGADADEQRPAGGSEKSGDPDGSRA